MKKIALFNVILLLLISFSLSAQQEERRTPPTRQKRETQQVPPKSHEKMQSPEQHAQTMVSALNKTVQLTDEQQNTLTKWYTAEITKRNESMSKDKEDRQAMRETMENFRTDNNEKLKEVLTTEQYKLYKEKEAERKTTRPAGPPPGARNRENRPTAPNQ